MERWLSFSQWLSQQQGDNRDGGEGGSELTDRHHSAAPEPANHQARQLSARRRTGVQPTIPNCSTEQRLLESYQRARQELSVVLAVPGLPAHRAPVLTAKQAAALLRAISEPLVHLEVGRLTRRLSSPAKLVPIEERGLLTLWLLPNNNLTLCWHSAQPPAQPVSQPPQEQAAVAAAGVVVYEALAHFPANCFYDSEEPVAVIHTLRNDTSGRSFYVRPRADIAALSTEQAAEQLQQASAAGEAAATALPSSEASLPRLYFWLCGRDLPSAVQGLGRLKSLLRRPPTLAKRSGVPQKKLDEIASWLAKVERAAPQQPPAAEQQTLTVQPAGQPPIEGASDANCSATAEVKPASEGPAAALFCTPPRRQHLPLGSPPAAPLPPPAPTASSLLPNMLLGRDTSTPALGAACMAAAISSIAASSQGMAMAGLSGPAALLLPPVAASQPRAAVPPAHPTASGVVSASASAVYHDRRFNLLAPVAVAVVVTSVLQGGAGAASPAGVGNEEQPQQQLNTAGLQAEAVRHASVLAQQHVQAALERSGRRLMEEQLAEAVISSIRAGRSATGSSSRQRAQRERARQEVEERRWRAAQAMPKIRAAAACASAGRGGQLQQQQKALAASRSISSLPAPSSASTLHTEETVLVLAGSEGAPTAVLLAEQAQQAPGPVMAPPSRPCPRTAAAAAPLPAASPSAGGKVMLNNLQDLLGAGHASAAATPNSGVQEKQEQQQLVQQAAEVGGGKGREVGAGLAGSEVGTPGKVSLSGLFKLLNGCLDM